jgi:hypothetical protein
VTAVAVAVDGDVVSFVVVGSLDVLAADAVDFAAPDDDTEDTA